MRAAGDGPHGRRLRGLTVCCGAPACASTKRSRSTRPTSTSVAARCSCGAARAAGAAKSAWTRGPGSNCMHGSLAGSGSRSARCCASSAVARADGRGPAPRPARRFAGPATAAGVRRRFTPHQLRHAHAVEMAHEGVPLIVIQRQLGHSNLGITSIYLQGIDNAEIIETVHAREAPMVPARPCRRSFGCLRGLQQSGRGGKWWARTAAPCRISNSSPARPGVGTRAGGSRDGRQRNPADAVRADPRAGDLHL
jgi:hypothetical protein